MRTSLSVLLVCVGLVSCKSAPRDVTDGMMRAGTSGVAPRPVEATSLLGVSLYRPTLDSATRARLTADLERAQADARANPGSADALIWVGRRHGYLGEYQMAARVFTEGVRRFPDDPRMLRHRGHRYVTLRLFDEAVADLTRAATLMEGKPDQVEPDGAPNARNIPIGSLHSNVWYHLALAHYLRGNWDAAASTARRGIAVSSNPDRLVSQTHWLYMALRRAGKVDEARAALAPIRDDFDIIENTSYYTLLKQYRTGIPAAVFDSTLHRLENPSDLSLAYGLANWLLYNGDTTRAVQAFERILNSAQWASFGYIAAEADLARLRAR
jgi:tetratricopeptide (TPR) repeat protein